MAQPSSWHPPIAFWSQVLSCPAGMVHLARKLCWAPCRAPCADQHSFGGDFLGPRELCKSVAPLGITGASAGTGWWAGLTTLPSWCRRGCCKVEVHGRCLFHLSQCPSSCRTCHGVAFVSKELLISSLCHTVEHRAALPQQNKDGSCLFFLLHRSARERCPKAPCGFADSQ